MFGLNGLTDIAKILAKVMKPEAHMHFFCSALQFSLWYNALGLEQRKQEIVPTKILAEADLRTRRARV